MSALSNYDAEPIPKEKCPNVTAIWCEHGVCKLPSDPKPEPYPKGHALFLLDNRSDFGPNRWDEYLDVGKMTFRHMPGNHFSMMHDEEVSYPVEIETGIDANDYVYLGQGPWW